MAILDKFIQVMFEQGAERLLLASGQAASLERDGALRPVTREPRTAP